MNKWNIYSMSILFFFCIMRNTAQWVCPGVCFVILVVCFWVFFFTFLGIKNMKFMVKYNTNFKLLLYEEVLLSTLISRGVHNETGFFFYYWSQKVLRNIEIWNYLHKAYIFNLCWKQLITYIYIQCFFSLMFALEINFLWIHLANSCTGKYKRHHAF